MLPNLWPQSQGHLHQTRLRNEAITCSLGHRPPSHRQEWEAQAAALREELRKRLRLADESGHPLDPCFHKETIIQGEENPFRIVPVSFNARPGIRITATLYIPEGQGPGPFPAVLNVHGHFLNGKLGERVQPRGQTLAQRGFVVLSVDAMGAGERSPEERQWNYHGARAGAGLFLTGDSLLALQVRDNRRAVDFLESLPYVDRDRIAVTGASGGGNQTMWVAAMDERLKVAIPVVSVGSFESYVGRRNCVCEALPGGLCLCEEWAVLGLIAPRPLLVLNALHDSNITFRPETLKETAKVTQQIYALYGKREQFDHRIIDQEHGYWPEMLEVAVGWLQYWLQGKGPTTAVHLPMLAPVDDELQLCYPMGSRPHETVGYVANRLTVLQSAPKAPSPDLRTPEEQRAGLAELVGWDARKVAEAARKRLTLGGNGLSTVVIPSPRSIPLPAVYRAGSSKEFHLILSPKGKQSPFVTEQWAQMPETATALTLDLPAVGELAWERDEVRSSIFHDSSRACLWLGYTLVGEWAEALSALLQSVVPEGAAITIHAEKETALAALIALALTPSLQATVKEHEVPASFEAIFEQLEGSMAWIIPGVLQWGDLDLIRQLARR